MSVFDTHFPKVTVVWDDISDAEKAELLRHPSRSSAEEWAQISSILKSYAGTALDEEVPKTKTEMLQEKFFRRYKPCNGTPSPVREQRKRDTAKRYEEVCEFYEEYKRARERELSAQKHVEEGERKNEKSAIKNTDNTQLSSTQILSSPLSYAVVSHSCVLQNANFLSDSQIGPLPADCITGVVGDSPDDEFSFPTDEDDIFNDSLIRRVHAVEQEYLTSQSVDADWSDPVTDEEMLSITLQPNIIRTESSSRSKSSDDLKPSKGNKNINLQAISKSNTITNNFVEVPANSRTPSRTCTPDEIEQKRQAALQKLAKRNHKTSFKENSQAHTLPKVSKHVSDVSHSGPMLPRTAFKTSTNDNTAADDIKRLIEEKRIAALKLRQKKATMSNFSQLRWNM